MSNDQKGDPPKPTSPPPAMFVFSKDAKLSDVTFRNNRSVGGSLVHVEGDADVAGLTAEGNVTSAEKTPAEIAATEILKSFGNGASLEQDIQIRDLIREVRRLDSPVPEVKEAALPVAKKIWAGMKFVGVEAVRAAIREIVTKHTGIDLLP